MTFAVDADCFTINLDNGYTLTLEPCNEQGVPRYLQPDFNDLEHAKPQPHVKMIVTGNGTNVRHTVLDANELALQIKTFAEMPKPQTECLDPTCPCMK